MESVLFGKILFGKDRKILVYHIARRWDDISILDFIMRVLLYYKYRNYCLNNDARTNIRY